MPESPWQGSLFDLPQDDDDTPSWLLPKNWKSDRWKSAIKRASLSRPIKDALISPWLPTNGSWLDFGCGHGLDIGRINSEEYHPKFNFDPYYFPRFDLLNRTYKIVSLIYVLNIIEEPVERCKTLKLAWELTQSALIVAVRTDGAGQQFTSIGTFQKYYSTDEFYDLLNSYCPGARLFGIGSGRVIALRDS
jgi:DNA phosphorothioation-associated putative methyltransferase